MKPRKVVLVIEMFTNIPLKALKSKEGLKALFDEYLWESINRIDQASVQVVKEGK